MKEIAVVRLAPGKVAFYDEYTKIHLTLANPSAKIYEGMNLKRIKNSVKFGVLQVVVGSLATDVVTEVPVESVVSAKVEKQKAAAHKIVEQDVKTINEEIPQEDKIDNITVEHDSVEIAETVVDDTEQVAISDTAETVADAEQKPKRGRKKTAATNTNEVE